jgi:hypothetical protein
MRNFQEFKLLSRLTFPPTMGEEKAAALVAKEAAIRSFAFTIVVIQLIICVEIILCRASVMSICRLLMSRHSALFALLLPMSKE